MNSKIKSSNIAILSLVAAIFAGELASAACSLRQDALADTTAIGEYVRDKMVGKVKVSAGMPTTKQHLVDLDSPNAENLKILDSNGITQISKEPTPNRPYGGVIPLTKCHSITNLHVAKGLAESKNQPIAIGTELYASFGQDKSCEGSSAFKVTKKVKVAGFNPDAFFMKKGKLEVRNHMDWAILESDTALENVETPKISKEPFVIGDEGLRVGFSAKDLDKEKGFRLIMAEMIKIVSVGNEGLVKTSNSAFLPGSSGSSAYKAGKDGLELAGIFVGSGEILDIYSILTQIKETNANLLEDIARVAAGGDCRK